MTPQQTGIVGEEWACALLRQNGYRIRHRNFRSRYGEVDIVIEKGSTWAFVEVKTRATERFGAAASSVDARKQRKIVLAAREYIRRQGCQWGSGRDCASLYRFDVVVVGTNGNMLHVEGAFESQWAE